MVSAPAAGARGMGGQVTALGHRGTLGSRDMAQAAWVGRVSAPPDLAGLYTERLHYLPLGHAPPCPALLPPGLAAGRRPPQELAAAARRAREEAAACGAEARAALAGGGSAVAALAGAADGLGPDVVGLGLAATGRQRRAAGGGGGGGGEILWIPRVEERAAATLREHVAAGFGPDAWSRVLVAAEGVGAACRAAGADLVLDAAGLSGGPGVAVAASLGVATVTRPEETWASRAGTEQVRRDLPPPPSPPPPLPRLTRVAAPPFRVAPSARIMTPAPGPAKTREPPRNDVLNRPGTISPGPPMRPTQTHTQQPDSAAPCRKASGCRRAFSCGEMARGRRRFPHILCVPLFDTVRARFHPPRPRAPGPPRIRRPGGAGALCRARRRGLRRPRRRRPRRRSSPARPGRPRRRRGEGVLRGPMPSPRRCRGVAARGRADTAAGTRGGLPVLCRRRRMCISVRAPLCALWSPPLSQRRPLPLARVRRCASQVPRISAGPH